MCSPFDDILYLCFVFFGLCSRISTDPRPLSLNSGILSQPVEEKRDFVQGVNGLSWPVVSGLCFWTNRSHTPPPVVHTCVTSSQVVTANASRRSPSDCISTCEQTDAGTKGFRRSDASRSVQIARSRRSRVCKHIDTGDILQFEQRPQPAVPYFYFNAFSGGVCVCVRSAVRDVCETCVVN